MIFSTRPSTDVSTWCKTASAYMLLADVNDLLETAK